DIFDSVTGAWTSTALPHPRRGLVEVAAGGEILFAGGTMHSGDRDVSTDIVDVYDPATGGWTSGRLPLAAEKYQLATASVGTKAIFAEARSTDTAAGVADIYDAATGAWTSHALSGAGLAAIAIVDGKAALFSTDA